MKIRNKIWAMVLLIAVMVTTILPVVNAQAAVSSAEKKKILAFFKENCEDYMYYDTFRTEKFVFTDEIKTDIAVRSLVINGSIRNLEMGSINNMNHIILLNEKYKPGFGMLCKCSKSQKTKIEKQGKRMFGNSFKLSFGTRTYDKIYPLLAPQTSDKKYLTNEAGDWEDRTQTKIKSVTKKNGIYTVKFNLVRKDWDDGEINARAICTMKLKKNGSSYIIKDIKQSKKRYY